MLDRVKSTLRVHTSDADMLKFAYLWKKLLRRDQDLHILLDALSLDFVLDYKFVSYCINMSTTSRHNIIYTMYGSIMGGRRMRQMLLLLEAPTHQDLVKLNMYARKLLEFSSENPTGHYVLDLSGICDWTVAENLLLLDRWESTCIDLNTRKSMYPTKIRAVTQKGNRSNIRNETWDGRTFTVSPSFQIPRQGMLEFDYVSPRRPPRNAKSLSKDAMEKLCWTIITSNCLLKEVRTVLKNVSEKFFLNCLGVRQILFLFSQNTKLQLDLIVYFVNRTEDWYLNEKIVRASIAVAEWAGPLKNRLGWMVVFPWVQTDGFTFNMDFHVFEDRETLGRLFDYEDAEDGLNMVDLTWDKDYDGEPDILPMGLPVGWKTNCPPAGNLILTYICSSDNAQTKFRMEMASKYGLWSVSESNPDEDDKRTKWWMCIEGLPVELLEMAVHLLHKFDSVAQAYRYIDTHRRNEVIRSDFEAAFRKMGVDQKNMYKVTTCFRFLDRGGEGSISWAEFNSLPDKSVPRINSSYVNFTK